ncbi:MAG TPA: DUF5615 family PIN-like protein [Pirellulaceae bacterium]|jgi:hypothetical protein
MKLLLDENLSHKLRTEIVGHDVFTVAFMGWPGVENGELLTRAATDGFDALISKTTAAFNMNRIKRRCRCRS